MMNSFIPEVKYHSNYFKGIYITVNGYRAIYKPSHPMARSDGYIMEHRLVMENKLGRRLTKKEVVHHINGNRLDNLPENLELTDNSNHFKKHKVWDIWAKQSRNGREVECLVCNKKHYRKGYSLKRNKKYFCSIKCYFYYRNNKYKYEKYKQTIKRLA